MLISEAFDRYRLDVIVFRGQSRKTEENHEIVKRALIRHFGDVCMCDLTFSDFRDWKFELDKGRSAETVRNYIIKLRVVLAHLHAMGKDCVNPDTIPVPQRTSKVPEYITAEEVTKLIRATKNIRNKALISLLYASGVRVSECCRLDTTSINDKRFTVVGKGGKARLCFIDERTETLLDIYLSQRTDNNNALFIGKYDSHRITSGNVQEIFRIARNNAGFTKKVHPHTLRHSFATNLLQNNANMRYVQAMLGHSSLQTTQMYTHVVDNDLEAVYRDKHTI